jgi:thioredoxin-like negative regulator of GroEL
MTTLAPSTTSTPATTPTRKRTSAPLLLLFGSKTSGQSRRLDGFVAHVVQRRHNHGTFRYRIVDLEDRPDLFDRFHVDETPTLLVIDEGRVMGRLVGFHQPKAVEELLAPWLH